MGNQISKHDLEIIKDQQIGIEGHVVHARESHVGTATRHLLFPDLTYDNKDYVSTKVEQIEIEVSQEEKIDTMEREFEECSMFFEKHQLDRASRLAEDILEHYNTLGICPNRLPLLKKVLSQQKLVQQYYEILHGQGWNFKGNKDGIKVSSRLEGGSVGVLIQSPLNVPIEIFVAVVTQIDLFCKFVPFMKYSKCEKNVARNIKIGHTINDLPIIAKREAFFLGVGYDRLDYNNTVMLYTRSFTEDLELQKELGYEVKKTPGAVQLDYKYLVMEYTPTSNKTGWIKVGLNIDMKLKGVPMFLLDFGCRQFGFDFVSNILNIANTFQGSEWQKGVQKDPYLFNFFKGRLQEHLDNRQKQGSTQASPFKQN